jgi:hypothetical protein
MDIDNLRKRVSDLYSHLLSGIKIIQHSCITKAFVNYLRFFFRKFIPQLNKIVLTLFIIILSVSARLSAAELNIGTAIADITPALPVAVDGQFNLRIADTVETPLEANVVKLESRNGNSSIDMAIMVSCDLVGIPNLLVERIRAKVHAQIPELDEQKIFLNAIHTHTAPVLKNDMESNFRYPIPKTGVLQVEEYQAFFVQRVSDAIINAWKNRKPGSVSWGLSHAAIAYNRRIVYSKKAITPGNFNKGTALMYGNKDTPFFINREGTEDHDVNMLFFWNFVIQLT